MSFLQLKAAEIIDMQTEAHYAFYSSVQSTTGVHYHDFFELFLITDGMAVHNVNGERQVISEGALVLVRPQDTHCYEKHNDSDCQFINLAFLPKTIFALFDYLGEGFFSDRLLQAPMPPTTSLQKSEKQILENKLEKVNLIPFSNKRSIKTELRILLLEIFVNYFSKPQIEKEPIIPIWLKEVIEKMQGKENFTSGLDALLNMSGKSHEHICRVFRNNLGKTPTEFINNTRLEYAANLLLNTDMAALDISLEAGFDNLSHFNHLFKRRFKLSPIQFRKANKKISV